MIFLTGLGLIAISAVLWEWIARAGFDDFGGIWYGAIDTVADVIALVGFICIVVSLGILAYRWLP